MKLNKLFLCLSLILCTLCPVSAETLNSTSNISEFNETNTNQIDLEALEIGEHITQDLTFITDEGVTVNSTVEIYVEGVKSTRETTDWQEFEQKVTNNKIYTFRWTWDREEEGYLCGGEFTFTNKIKFVDGELQAVSTSINAVAPLGYTIHYKDAYFTEEKEYSIKSTGVVETRLLTDLSPIGISNVMKFEAELCTPNTVSYRFKYKS